MGTIGIVGTFGTLWIVGTIGIMENGKNFIPWVLYWL